jgi:formylglycine-generating enzyme required for sulfatase activity
MVLIEPGEFMMGSSETEEGRDGDEGPRRRARIPRPFYLGKFAATQAQYESVMGTNPSHFKGENNPVEMVSWNDAKEFCRRLGPGFRLPTEAEWEYACRAGTATPFYFGETVSTDQANYDGTYAYGEGREGDYREKTVPVNSFEPNGWGLYNMHGNVWEWCEDWYDGDYYKGRPSPDFDPQGPPGGDSKVLHGGSWDDDPKLLRSAYRLRYLPASKYNTCGFRIARSIDW